MWVYAAFGPIAGLAGDRVSRKMLILGGLIFWSLITLATALSTKYSHLVLFRALEGFGEAFYFPASMSMLSSYHGPNTRSRAMAIHQSSVYAGTIAGGSVAGVMGQAYGWRSSFYLFGALGTVLGILLILMLREPEKESARARPEEIAQLPTRREINTPGDEFDSDAQTAGAEVVRPVERDSGAAAAGARRESKLHPQGAGRAVAELFGNPMFRILTVVFVGANFVASIFLTWTPSFLFRKFNLSLAMAGVSATVYLQIASVLGVLCGGVIADRLAGRNKAGRMLTQAIGLTLGVPFIFAAGWTISVPLMILALTGFGFFKGLYDANIWASLHDVVSPQRRAAAVGLMNSIGWIGGGIAPVAVAAASERFGLSASISANSLTYLLVACLLFYGIRKHARNAGPEC
jgi:predicted MFS family arabinose efflux permease